MTRVDGIRLRCSVPAKVADGFNETTPVCVVVVERLFDG